MARKKAKKKESSSNTSNITLDIINLPGHPLRLHELDINNLARMLYDDNVRTTTGKRIGELIIDGVSTFVGLHEGQRGVVDSPSRFKVLGAGRRYGKTLMCALMALAAVMQPSRKIWIVGPEYEHVKRVFGELYSILVRQLKWIKKGATDGSIARNSKGDYVLRLPDSMGGSEITGKTSKNKDSLAGDGLDLIIFDEAALAPDLDTVWSQMLRATLSDNLGSAIFISSPRGKNDFYRLYKLGQLGKRQREGFARVEVHTNGDTNDFRDWDSWAMPTYTNPFIPRSEYEDAKREALQKGKYLLFRQEWDADFDAVSDAAFPEFNAYVRTTEKDKVVEKSYHVQDYRYNSAFGPWYSSSDFNIARPASTVYAQVDNQSNVMIFDELFRTNTTTYMQAEFVLEKVRELGRPYNDVIGDVSGSFASADGMNSFDQFESVLGHQPAGIRQGRETGNHLIHEWLAYPVIDKHGQLQFDENNNPQTYPKLFIASHCVETIFALETAKRKLGQNGSIKEDYGEIATGHEGLL